MAIPGAREIDPQDEMGRLAKERLHGPAKVLHVGDVIRVYGTTGNVFTGRIAEVAVDLSDPGCFGVICAPLEEESA